MILELYVFSKLKKVFIYKFNVLQQYATTLVMKLQLLVQVSSLLQQYRIQTFPNIDFTLIMRLYDFCVIQEVNNVIEETSQEVVTNLPRVVRDVEVIKQEALILHDQMKSIKHDIQKVITNQTHLSVHSSGKVPVQTGWVYLHVAVSPA